MSVHELRTAESGMSEEYQVTQLQTWLAYVFYAAVGMVGGGIGVALAIGLMIIVAETSAIVFDPNSILLIGVAILFGLGITWLLERVVRYVMTGMNMSQRHQQVIFVFSMLVVLLESFIFMP
jgi:hypothetical protein